MYSDISKDEVGQIAEIMLKEVFEDFDEEFNLVTDRFKTRLIDEGYNPTNCSTTTSCSYEITRRQFS